MKKFTISNIVGVDDWYLVIALGNRNDEEDNRITSAMPFEIPIGVDPALVHNELRAIVLRMIPEEDR